MHSLLRCELGAHHKLHFNATHHFIDTAARSFPASVALEIVQAEDNAHFYLILIAESGPSADTFHLTLDDAKHQAAVEFGVKENEWIKSDWPL